MKRTGARLGQHFLTGTWAAHKLVESAGIREGDTILEIGPGKGALTRELLKTGARVIAIEKDEALVQKLREDPAFEKLKVIEADIRDIEPENIGLAHGGYILAANIPYYITGEIIRQFLTARAQPKTMALLVQKEVAERILARDGKESILSISVKAYGEPSIAAKVAKGNFNPPPSVDSAILVIRNISKTFFEMIDEERFFHLVRTGFSSKRKKLRGNLKGFGELPAHIEENARAEDLSLEQWREIYLHLFNS